MLFLLALSLLMDCATADYGTFEHRSSEFRESTVALSDGGLTAEQIAAILSTEFPPETPVSFSLIYVNSGYRRRENILPYVIDRLNTVNWIDTVVPIPNSLIPRELTFISIQALGIRSLCEYSILFIADSYTEYRLQELLSGVYHIASELEFLVIDNQTTAIIASDKLISSIETKIDPFGSGEREKNSRLLMEEQANILKGKLETLFSR